MIYEEETSLWLCVKITMREDIYDDLCRESIARHSLTLSPSTGGKWYSGIPVEIVKVDSEYYVPDIVLTFSDEG